MGIFVFDSLDEGENIIEYSHPNRMSNFWLIVIGLCTAVIGVGLILLLIAMVDYYSREILLTNKRIVAKSGLSGKPKIDLPLDEIEKLTHKSCAVGSAFDFGDVHILKKDGTSVVFNRIRKPFVFSMNVNIYLDKVRESANG